MKPKPLKNKEIDINNGKVTYNHNFLCDSEDLGLICYSKQDIKLAVEWLKLYINECKEIGSPKQLIKIDFVIERIDEAFEDVIEND